MEIQLFCKQTKQSMGCHWSLNQIDNQLRHVKKENILKAATLNYCGISKSPFQFYSGNHITDLEELSRIFQRLRPEYVKQSDGKPFTWQMSTLDKKLKDNRYCPFYNLMVGIQNNSFVTKKRFEEIWRETFSKETEKNQLSISQNEIQEGLQFDLLAFHTLLTFVYSIKRIDEAANICIDQYLATYSPYFEQAFLDKDKKLQLFVLNLERDSADIVFIQQASQQLIQYLCSLQKYYVQISSDKDTLIIAKRQRFLEQKSKAFYIQKLSTSQTELINWNGHTSIMFLDTYVLISGHLSSKKSINPLNIEALKKTMILLQQKFPEFDIICGCDANSFIDRFSQKINLFPGKNSFTTMKKRTSMQTQSQKAEIQVKQSKDVLLSTLSIIEGKILTISGSECTETMYLPINDHPFDHFLVQAHLMKRS